MLLYYHEINLSKQMYLSPMQDHLLFFADDFHTCDDFRLNPVSRTNTIRFYKSD